MKTKKLTKDQLINVCSRICYYAQDHSKDTESWGKRNTKKLAKQLHHTSYTVACFIAQNTKYGKDGVEFDILLKQLVGNVLTFKEWKKIITELIKHFNTYVYFRNPS